MADVEFDEQGGISRNASYYESKDPKIVSWIVGMGVPKERANAVLLGAVAALVILAVFVFYQFGTTHRAKQIFFPRSGGDIIKE